MSGPLISVIIPVYKVEKYLDRCITSVVNQTYQNLEIILVDDGSTDNCPQMCDAWSEKDERISVIHKENGGVSSARNAGMESCKGTFVAFLDGDDWLEPEMYEKLFEVCNSFGTRMACCGRNDVYECTGQTHIGKCPVTTEILSAEQILSDMLCGKNCDFSVSDKLFRRDLWDDIRFPEGRIYEDIAILYRVIIKSGRVAMCNTTLFNYFHREGSITTLPFRKDLCDYPEQTRKVMREINELFPALYEQTVWMHTKALQCVLSAIANSNYSQYRMNMDIYRAYAKELSSYKNVWKNSPVFSKKDCIRYHLLTSRLYRLTHCVYLLAKKYQNRLASI